LFGTIGSGGFSEIKIANFLRLKMFVYS